MVLYNKTAQLAAGLKSGTKYLFVSTRKSKRIWNSNHKNSFYFDMLTAPTHRPTNQVNTHFPFQQALGGRAACILDNITNSWNECNLNKSLRQLLRPKSLNLLRGPGNEWLMFGKEDANNQPLQNADLEDMDRLTCILLAPPLITLGI